MLKDPTYLYILYISILAPVFTGTEQALSASTHEALQGLTLQRLESMDLCPVVCCVRQIATDRLNRPPNLPQGKIKGKDKALMKEVAALDENDAEQVRCKNLIRAPSFSSTVVLTIFSRKIVVSTSAVDERRIQYMPVCR